MLPTFLPQTGELLKFDNSINNMDLLPESAVTPDAGFSELLQLKVDELPTIELEAGDLLPPAGSQLPLQPDMAPIPADLLTSLDPVAEEIAPVQPSPEITLPRIELDVSAEQAPDAALVTELQQAADSAETLIPINAERVAPPVTDNVRAAVRELVREAEPPKPVTPDVKSTPAAIGAIDSESVDIEAQLIRPLAETRAEPVRRAELAVAPDAVSGDARSAAPRDTLTQAVAAATQSQPAVEGSPEGAGIKLQSVQQLAQSLSQVIVSQGQPAQVSPAIAPSAQPITTEMAAGALPGATSLIDTPVADSAWGDRLGERVLLMAGNQLRNAEIRLTPAELGPVRVQVAVDEGTANITFHAQHAVTRDAIEQALPRLREMLVENGLSLGEASVGEQGVAGQENATREGTEELVSFGADGDDGATPAASDSAAAETRIRVTNGLVDTFV